MARLPTTHLSPILSLFLLLLLLLPACHAHLELAQTLGSHMVLQRAPHRAAIYGRADPLAPVAVTVQRDAVINGTLTGGDGDGDDGPASYERTYRTVASPGGKFLVLLDPVKVSKSLVVAHTITVENGRTFEKVAMTDVLFGEVWLCSGQSNMQMTVGQCFERDEEGEKAGAYPLIRLFTVGTNTSDVPLDDLAAPHQPWTVSSREAVLGNDWEHFSAVCFFFGRRLADHFHVPIGLVASSYGGTPIIAWSDAHTVQQCPITSTTAAPAAAAAASTRLRRRAEDNATAAAAAAVAVEGALGGPTEPSVLYNSMIHPLRKVAFKGAVWYQGEADAGQPDYYECAFPAMVRNWRRLFRHSQVVEEGGEASIMPFGFVQLSSYDSGLGAQGVDIGRMRIAQYAAFQEPEVFMAPAFDLGDKEGGIHPRDKQDLGFRLAGAGLFTAYKEYVLAAELGPFIKKTYAYLAADDENTLELKVELDNVDFDFTYVHVPDLLEVVLDPSDRDATEGALVLTKYVKDMGKNGTCIFSFQLPQQQQQEEEQEEEQDGGPRSLRRRLQSMDEVLLRYGYRNNICPSREAPYMQGVSQASCGVYGKSRTGFAPMLPILKRVPLLPFDPTLSQGEEVVVEEEVGTSEA